MNKEKKDGDFSKSIIKGILIFLVLFVIAVFVVFVVTGGSEPTTLIISVFSLCGFEFGILGWIKTDKEKKELKKEDAERLEKEKQLAEREDILPCTY